MLEVLAHGVGTAHLNLREVLVVLSCKTPLRVLGPQMGQQQQDLRLQLGVRLRDSGTARGLDDRPVHSGVREGGREPVTRDFGVGKRRDCRIHRIAHRCGPHLTMPSAQDADGLALERRTQLLQSGDTIVVEVSHASASVRRDLNEAFGDE
mgnify:FL=1